MCHVEILFLFGLSQIIEISMFESLSGRNSFVRIVYKELHDEVLSVLRDVWDEVSNASTRFLWEIECHVTGMLLEPVK